MSSHFIIAMWKMKDSESNASKVMTEVVGKFQGCYGKMNKK